LHAFVFVLLVEQDIAFIHVLFAFSCAFVCFA